MRSKTLPAMATVVALSLSMFVGCNNGQDKSRVATGSQITTNKPATTPGEPIETTLSTTTSASSATTVQSEGPTEIPHSHTYSEAVTTEPTCESDGVKTFTCECGDSYTELITAAGHKFESYSYNNDATYTADGTETAVCVCGLTDTRTKNGSKLEYTYTELDKIMYAGSSVNVRDLPSVDGNKIGGLSKAQEVYVKGICNETRWYQIDYNGSVGCVSDTYLQDSKPLEEVVIPPSETQPTNTNEECPYELYVIYYDDQDYPYFYGHFGGSGNMDADNWAKTSDCLQQSDRYIGENHNIMNEENGWTEFHTISWQNIGLYGGVQIVLRYVDGVNGVLLSSPESRGIPTAGNGIW